MIYTTQMRKLFTFAVCSFTCLSVIFMFTTKLNYSAMVTPVKDDNGGLQQESDEHQQKLLQVEEQLQKPIPVKDKTSLKISSLLEFLNSLDVDELEELKKYFRIPTIPEEQDLDFPSAIFNSTLNFVKLKLLHEVTDKTYEKILQSTLQGKPINERVLPGSLQIIIATTFRSGSTFLEELLVSHPGVFNHYEPLLMYNFQRFYKEDPLSEEALEIILDLLNCRYKNSKYLNAMKEFPDLIMRNTRFFSVCKQSRKTSFNAKTIKEEKLCHQREFLEQACALYPWTVMKLVRAGVDLLEPVFQDSSLNPHLVFLVRDPRAVINSRQSTVKWCKTPLCSDPSILCEHMSRDLAATIELGEKYPGRIHILRYEDLALSPAVKAQQLVRDIGLDFDTEMIKFIDEHTTKNYDKPWSTTRESAKRVLYWTTKIKENILLDIQKSCSKIMDKLGYLKIDSLNNSTIEEILVPSLNLTFVT